MRSNVFKYIGWLIPIVGFLIYLFFYLFLGEPKEDFPKLIWMALGILLVAVCVCLFSLNRVLTKTPTAVPGGYPKEMANELYLYGNREGWNFEPLSEEHQYLGIIIDDVAQLQYQIEHNEKIISKYHRIIGAFQKIMLYTVV